MMRLVLTALILMAPALGFADAAYRAIPPTNNTEAIAKFVDLVKEKAREVGKPVILMKGKNSNAQAYDARSSTCSVRVTQPSAGTYIYEVLEDTAVRQTVTFRGAEDFDPAKDKSGFSAKVPHINYFLVLHVPKGGQGKYRPRTIYVAMDSHGSLVRAEGQPNVGCVCEENK